MVPCVIFEDEHLLVVNKPPGWNTHAPSPHAGEGIYDWFRHREPRWAPLAILHRLDKETSGVLVFGKTPVANRSLTHQFTDHSIRKRYLLLTDRPVSRESWTLSTKLARAGSRYASVPKGREGESAETRFTVVSRSKERTQICAEPLTGRTHQIRVHAAESGIPVLGDTLYGGSPFARVCLHAESITVMHPAEHRRHTFSAPADFEVEGRWALRAACIDPAETNACRLIHGAADGWPGWQVDRLGDYLLSQSEAGLEPQHAAELERLLRQLDLRGAYHKQLSRQVRRTAPGDACPGLVQGEPAPDRFTILENGLHYELSFTEGYSVGLFLDQRDNRKRLLSGHVAAGFPALISKREPQSLEILNAFSYTCAFSVCAAKGGARVTSLDLSRKYLDWGRRNFELNGLASEAHDFIYGEAFDWMKRLHKKGRLFDTVILDPPTFSQSKQSGVFRAEKDYGELVRAAVSLLRTEGVLLTSSNAAQWDCSAFLGGVREAVDAAGRRVIREHYQPQPPDFPITRLAPAHLKTAWWVVG